MDNISCINKGKTLIELGVDIEKLKPNSCKLVYRNCIICSIEQLITFRDINIYKRYKCISCSNKINNQGKTEAKRAFMIEYHKTHEHPRLGVKHTEEARKKIKENRGPYIVTEKTKEKLRLNKGPLNKNFGRKRSDETKAKMSAAGKIHAKRGKECNLYGKCYYAKHIKYLSKSGIEYKLKSGWELKIAQYLDGKDIIWEYEKQAFPVIYEYEGQVKDGTYTPDFFVGDEIWEVKGYWRKDAKIKFETFLKTYPQYKVKLLQKQEIESLGIKL